MTDYKDLIESLSSYSTEVISYKIDGAFAYAVTAAADAIERLVKERDAAVAEIRKYGKNCRTCLHGIAGKGDCLDDMYASCVWEWRGVQNE